MAERLGPAAILALVVLGIIAVNGMFSGNNSPAKTAEQTAQDEAKELRYRMAVVAGRNIKQALREPDSVQWNTMLVSDKSDIVCIEYRARNGFGGMNIERLIITNELTSDKLSAWVDHCHGDNMHDVTYARHAI